MVSYIDLMENDSKEVKKIISKMKIKPKDKAFSYASKLKHGMSNLEVDTSVSKGIRVLRLTSRGTWKNRMITLSSDKQALFITHSEMPRRLSSQLASTLSIPKIAFTRRSSKELNDGERFVRHLDVADIDGWQVGAMGVQKLEYAKIPAIADVDSLLTIFHHGSKSMCFIVPDKEKCNHLVETMEKMKHRYNLMAPWIDNDQILLRYIYYDIDKNKSGTIDVYEFREICKRINFKTPPRLDKIFMEFSNNKEEISIEKTLQLLREVSVGNTVMPADLVWDDLFGNDVVEVEPEVFLEEFLKGCQGETNLDLKDAERMIESLNTFGKSKLGSNNITRPAFVHFLLSKYNDAFDPAAQAERPSSTKFDRPISEYWINTSHNTYLLGDQLKSTSSVEAYQNALSRGCKCLELDCWDGSEDKQTKEPVPVIYHGHTLTPKMTFRNACLVTQSYLVANPETYPIILSLENHCSLPYQKVMAKDMEEIFGENLYIPTEKEFSTKSLPSPEGLRGKVIIKGKRPPEPDEGADENSRRCSVALLESYVADSDSDDEYTIASPTSTSSVTSASSQTTNSSKNSKDKTKKKKKKKPKVQSELKRLTLLHGACYHNFRESCAQKASTMHSIGETKIPKLVSKAEINGNMWREYNRNHMTRTYPAGYRVDSSNYNPILAWAMGCQLVALNFQTSDSNLALNDGLFRQAGSCGYIPKPASLMGGKKPNPTKVRISVLSARCIPKPNGVKLGEVIDPYADPYVELDLHDVRIGGITNTEEHVKEEYVTPHVNNNGFNPVWKKDATFEFDVHSPDVAMIHFRIVDEDFGTDEKIADASIPISCLRKGYRSIQLYDRNNTRTGPFGSSTLFVKIE